MGANQNTVLMAVLECGTSDLCMLDDIRYDLGEIVESLLSEGIKPTLNSILGEVFRKGTEEMAQFISDRLCEPHEDDSEETMAALRSLDPERDIRWYCNCLDTYVYFEQNEEIYRQYLEYEISIVEENMGYSF